MDLTEKTLSRREIYDWRIVHLHVDEVELPDGSRLVASRHGIDQSLAPGQKLCVRWAPEAAVPVEVDD